MRGPGSGYRLVWSEEFAADGAPDPSVWRYDTEYNRPGWHNKEAQYYSADRRENAQVRDGRLVIEARKEELASLGLSDWGGQHYSSARLITRDTVHFQQGYLEIRAKLPCTVGSWPAIWLLPVEHDRGWPADGEIDIVEHLGFSPGRVYHSLHTANLNHLRGTQPTAESLVPSVCDDFHVYHLQWTRDRIEMGVDGRTSFRLAREPGSDWPFDKPFYLILNVAVGGTWGGSRGIADEGFPSRLEVDHIRYYRAV